MTITPQDVQSKQFHVRMRGFDMDEVDKFLEKIAEELLIVSLENKQLHEKIEAMEKELANYKNKEQAFQSAILSAQRISDEMQARSRHDSEEIMTNARQAAEEMETRIRQEVDELVEKSLQEAAKVKANAESDARQILENSQKQHRDLTLGINHLIEIKGRIMSDLRQLLNNYLEHIEEAVPSGLNVLEPLPIAEENVSTDDEEEAPFSSAVSENIDDPDLEDLYEKIALPNESAETIDDNPNRLATLEINDIEPLELDDFDDDDNLAPSVPIDDLNGVEEMLFSLDDPLDELEPSVTINKDDKPD